MWICPECKSQNQGSECPVCGRRFGKGKKKKERNFDKIVVTVVIGILTCVLLAVIAHFSVKTHIQINMKPQPTPEIIKTPEPTIKPIDKKADTKTDYQKYAKYFGGERDDVLKYYPTVNDSGTWLDATWYEVNGERYFAFDEKDKKCVAVMAPIVEIYPDLEKGYKVITKGEFEEYIGIKTQFIEKHKDFSTPILKFEHKGYEVYATCDRSGNVAVESHCMYKVAKESN